MKLIQNKQIIFYQYILYNIKLSLINDTILLYCKSYLTYIFFVLLILMNLRTRNRKSNTVTVTSFKTFFRVFTYNFIHRRLYISAILRNESIILSQWLNSTTPNYMT